MSYSGNITSMALTRKKPTTVATAPDHRAFREAIDRSRTRYVPGLVLAELDYFLRKEREAMSGEPLPMLPRLWHRWTAPWTSIANIPIWASAS